MPTSDDNNSETTSTTTTTETDTSVRSRNGPTFRLRVETVDDTMTDGGHRRREDITVVGGGDSKCLPPSSFIVLPDANNNIDELTCSPNNSNNWMKNRVSVSQNFEQQQQRWVPSWAEKNST